MIEMTNVGRQHVLMVHACNDHKVHLHRHTSPTQYFIFVRSSRRHRGDDDSSNCTARCAVMAHNGNVITLFKRLKARGCWCKHWRDLIFLIFWRIKGATLVSHDSEATIDVGNCNTPGCNSRAINYAGGATTRQFAALVDLSTSCSQFIRVRKFKLVRIKLLI